MPATAPPLMLHDDCLTLTLISASASDSSPRPTLRLITQAHTQAHHSGPKSGSSLITHYSVSALASSLATHFILSFHLITPPPPSCNATYFEYHHQFIINIQYHRAMWYSGTPPHVFTAVATCAASAVQWWHHGAPRPPAVRVRDERTHTARPGVPGTAGHGACR